MGYGGLVKSEFVRVPIGGVSDWLEGNADGVVNDFCDDQI